MSRKSRYNYDRQSGPSGPIETVLFEDLGNYTIAPVVEEKIEPPKRKYAYKEPVVKDLSVIATGTVVVDTLTKRKAASLQANVLADKGYLHTGDKVSLREIKQPLPDLAFGRTTEDVWVVIRRGRTDYIKLD